MCPWQILAKKSKSLFVPEIFINYFTIYISMLSVVRPAVLCNRQTDRNGQDGWTDKTDGWTRRTDGQDGWTDGQDGRMDKTDGRTRRTGRTKPNYGLNI